MIRNLRVFEKKQSLEEPSEASVTEINYLCFQKKERQMVAWTFIIIFTQNFRRLLRRETFPAKGLLSKHQSFGSPCGRQMSTWFQWQTSGPPSDPPPKAPDYSHPCANSSAQNSQKRPEPELQGLFLFCLLLCFCSVTAWNLRPLGWPSLSSLPSLSLLILLVVQSVQRARVLSLYSYLPLWPRASKQMLTISWCINKTSHSTAVSPGPSPVGGAGEFECLTIHHIASPGRMRNDWACPHCDWIIQIPLPRSAMAPHTLGKGAEPGHRPTHSTRHSGRKWQGEPARGAPWSDSMCGRPWLLGGRSVVFFCLANRAGNATKQNKMLTCWVMTNRDTCHKRGMTALLLLWL